jgi:hypothetical protein
MTKRRKLVISAILAAILVLGTFGGIVLADEGDSPQPRVEFLERLAAKLGITVDELQAKITEVRDEMPTPEGDGWCGQRGPGGRFGGLLADLDEETQAALKEALAQAKEDMQGQEGVDRHAVIAGILADFGIDVDALKANLPEGADGERPFKRGFGGPRGDRCAFGGPPAPTE